MTMTGEDGTKRYSGKPMKAEADLHPVNWKSGTEALGLCMICGGQYPPDARECPDCNVSLSVVRRCPQCDKIVSAQHRKCVYCRTPFTHELPQGDAAAELPRPEQTGAVSPAMRRFRAALVSVSTFVIVFSLGMLFLRQINKPVFSLQVVAQAKLVRSAELRRSPSSTASNVGQVSSGTTVNLTGFQENDHGRWMAVDWNNTIAYLPANAVSAPYATEPTEGARALKFYLTGMDSAEAAEEAINAVDDYAQRFPGNAHGEELRLELADRLKALAQRGGPRGADLHRLAGQQYERLAASNGQFAGKARETLTRTLPAPQPGSKPRLRATKKDGLQIIGGSGTGISSVQSAAHEVLVLTQAEVRVRPGKLAQLAAGTVVAAHVATQVKANGMVAIPAGAACQLTVVSADPSTASLSVALTSIEIDQRAYAVRSQVVDVHSGGTLEHALSFRLSAPLVISR